MLKAGPKPVDVNDLQFKLQCQLQIFDNRKAGHFTKNCSLVAVASRFGLIFLGTPDDNFQVLSVLNLEEVFANSEHTNEYSRRYVALNTSPLFLAVNYDQTVLAVIIERNHCSYVKFYDVKSFVEENIIQLQEVQLSASEVNIVDVNWNPMLPYMFTACKSDGTLGIYEINGQQVTINELPSIAGVTCFCWSPKGKQIAVGSRDGKITQYKPDLKAVKIINAPPFNRPHLLISLQWVSNYQFIGIFKPVDSDSQSCLIVIDAPKTGNPVYLNYEDICYNSSTRRLMQFYTILQQDWNMLLIASSNSMEVGILGNSADEWKQWSVGDASRAELPLSSDHEDTLPIGFALETSTTQGLQLGETKLPAFPMLLLLSDHGTLCCFTVLNLKEGIPNICTKSELTLNVNDLQYFVKHEGRQLISNSTERQSELPMSSTATSVNDTLVSTNYSKPISQPSMFANETRLSDNAENLISNNSVFQSTTPLNYSVLDRSGGKDTVSDAMSRPQQKLPGDPPSSQHILSQSPDRTNKLEVTQDTTEALFANMVKEESVYLESSLKAVLHQGKKLKIILGTDAEKNNFLVSLQALNDFFGEILEICATQTTEVHLLKQNLLQSWAWYEDAKAHYIASRDNSNLLLLKARPLDSASQKRLEDLRYENYYLQSQIAQAHRKLDEEWEQFQDYCRKHHILQIPTMELIFQTMVKQNTILSKQSYILKDIGSRIRRKGRNIIDSSSLLISNDNFELETHELQGNLDSTCQFRHKRAACLNKKKSHDLRNFLLTRDFPHVTAIKVNTSASILESSPSKTHKQLDSLRLKTSPCVESRLSQNVASADSKTELRSKEFGTSIQKLTDLTLTVGSAAKHFEPAVNKSAISGSLNSAFASTFLGPGNPLSVPTDIEAVDQGSGTTVVSLTKTTPSHFKTSFNALETFSSLSTAKTTSSMRSPALTTPSQVTISPLSTLTTNTKKSPTSLNLNVKDESINTFSFLNVPELTKAPSNQSPRTPSTSYSTSNIPLDKTATATPNLSSVFSKNVFFTTAPIVSSASSDNISRTTSIFGKTDTDYAVTKPSGLSTISSANIFGNLPTSSTHTIPQSTVNTSTVAKVQAATNYAMAPTQSNATSPINLSQLSALPGAVKPSAFVATTNYPLTSSTRASTVTTSTPSMLSGSFDNTEQTAGLARTSLVSNDNTEKSIFGNTDSHLPRQNSYFRDLGANGNKLLEMRNTLSESSPKSTIVGTAASINTLSSRPSISEQISFSKTTGSTTTQHSSSEKHSVPTEVSSVFGNSSFGGNKTIFGNTPQIVNSNFDIKTEQPLLSNTKDVNPVFGQGTTFGTSSNNFGSTGNFSSPAASFTYSTGSIFGNTTTMTSNTPFANTTTLSSKKSIFGNSESGEAPVFGTGSVNFQTPVTSSFSGFDSLSITSKLKTTTPFGFGGASVTNVFNSAPPEGQPADKKNIFENSSTGIFGATSGSIFGSPSVSFSNSPQFGQNTFSNTGTVAQKPSGLFSGVSDTVSQSGFGASSANMPKPGGFGSAPVFGTSPAFGPTPAFGGSPGFSSSFGASPTFGGPSKIFGSENSGFEAAATPQSASFGNLANQPVVGFGNLAQQVPNSAPGSSQFTSNSSFSNWR